MTDDEMVVVEIETTEPFLEYLRDERRPDTDWSAFFLAAAKFYVNESRDLRGERPQAVAHVARKAVERAKLRARDREIRGGDTSWKDYLHEEVDLLFEYAERVDAPQPGCEDGC